MDELTEAQLAVRLDMAMKYHAQVRDLEEQLRKAKSLRTAYVWNAVRSGLSSYRVAAALGVPTSTVSRMIASLGG